MQRDLVIRARNGDHEAFSLLAEASFDQLLRTARLILRDDERAGNSLQHQPPSPGSTFSGSRSRPLRRLAPPAARSCPPSRGKRVRRRRAMEVESDPATAPPRTTCRKTAQTRDRSLSGGFTLRLTMEQRALLVVHHYLGPPDFDAAVALDVPVGTFRSRPNRSASLRAALGAGPRAVRQGSRSHDAARPVRCRSRLLARARHRRRSLKASSAGSGSHGRSPGPTGAAGEVGSRWVTEHLRSLARAGCHVPHLCPCGSSCSCSSPSWWRPRP